MNVTGKTTIYINGFEGKENVFVNVSAKVKSQVLKGKNTEYVTSFIQCKLSNAVKDKLDDSKWNAKTKLQYNVEIKEGWLGTYLDNKGNNVIYLFINDLDIIVEDSEGNKKTYQRYRK